MNKKVTDPRNKAHRYGEIARVLIQAGWVGMRVAGVANAIGKSKSYTHKLLLEMVEAKLITRQVEYADGQHFNVNYCYYQLPLFENGINNHYDGLNGECTMCGKDFSGSADGMCSSCRQVWNG